MIRLGILGASEIAFRRFLPALITSNKFQFIGVATRNPDRAQKFIEKYGGMIFKSYDELLNSKLIDCVYIPLPPSLHYEWAKKSLNLGYHVLVEKPFTTNLIDTKELIALAIKKNLSVVENFAFMFHSQINEIDNIINNNILGEIRLYRMAFGYPLRPKNDFRFSKELGGGALLDAGVYPIRLSQHFLGDILNVAASSVNLVDQVIYNGSATIENKSGLISQISYGMDNAYKCELEIWGSKSILKTNRIFTAGPDFKTEINIIGDINHTLHIEPEDHFIKLLIMFSDSIKDISIRENNNKSILDQSQILQIMIDNIQRKEY